MAHTQRTIQIGDKTVILVGTAHISRESIAEVQEVLHTVRPERVCVEIDMGRYRAVSEGTRWEQLDIVKVIKEGKGFLLLANLALSGFQKRLGSDLGTRPGEEMLAAINTAEEMGIPWSAIDREVQLTLKRAWARSNLWNKSKLLASLIESAFSRETLSEDELEKLKDRNELEHMMNELASYLPSVKEVLIDERDRYLATQIFLAPEHSVVAVVGAGHMQGIETWLGRLERGEVPADVQDIDRMPEPGWFQKSAGWLIPLLIVGLIALGFFRGGTQASLAMIVRWILLNGSLAALGSLLCLAHPFTILTSFLLAPIATLNPILGIGLFAAVVEAHYRKPTVLDAERLADDVTSLKGFYTNRITHILLVFFLSSIGGMIGNFIALPMLASNAMR
ncbi:MAG: TraB/GumN family protein [Spirochaetales bacterium]|nr:TraB/GumN family protein [Spirochaetales bacterium]